MIMLPKSANLFYGYGSRGSIDINGALLLTYGLSITLFLTGTATLIVFARQKGVRMRALGFVQILLALGLWFMALDWRSAWVAGMSDTLVRHYAHIFDVANVAELATTGTPERWDVPLSDDEALLKPFAILGRKPIHIRNYERPEGSFELDIVYGGDHDCFWGVRVSSKGDISGIDSRWVTRKISPKASVFIAPSY